MLHRISFSYIPHKIINSVTGTQIGESFRPEIEIRISKGNYISDSFDALVDSGSDKSLLPAWIGEGLGLNFNKSDYHIIYGIGGAKVRAFTKRVKLHVNKFSFETEVDFSFDQQIPLLGRQGFFDLFKSVTFREKDKFLDLAL